MESGAAGGGTEIAGGARDWRERFYRYATHFSQERKQTRIRLMRSERPDGAAWDSTKLFEGGKNPFHARDGGARKSFAVEHYVERAISAVFDLDRFRILACTAEKKFAQAISERSSLRFRAAKYKGACAIAEQSAKFAGNSPGNERAAVEVGGDHRDRARLTRDDQRLCNRQGVDQPQACATDIECAASFTRSNAGMQLGGERRVDMMGFAGGDHRVDFFGAAT